MKKQYFQKAGTKLEWQRIVLLIIITYEALGSLLGGSLLIAAPDGSYMDMPVDLLHGVFSNFLIPGIILFGLGILNTIGFIAIIRRSGADLLLAILGLGGFVIWFLVEIIILGELHWLHAMLGLPVLVGWVMIIPLLTQRYNIGMMRRALLTCGILSSLWYVAINVFVPMMYDGYSITTFTVSELSAIGAPTRILWVLLCLWYPLLLAAFGWGVLYAAGESRALRIAGSLIILYSIINFYWPPMHQREIIGAGGGTLTDILHIIWAIISLIFMMAIMRFGASALGKGFRRFTIAIFVIFILFGVLIGTESPGIQANLPTPYIGIWERINIGAFMLWVIVFAKVLLSRKQLMVSIQ